MNDKKLEDQTLDGKYKVTFKEMKDGEYNIDVDDLANDGSAKSNSNRIVIAGLVIAILLASVSLFVGMQSSENSKQLSAKNEKNVQDLQQSYAELQYRVDALVNQNRLSQKTEKKSPKEDKEELSSNEVYGIKKVSVVKPNVKIPEIPTVDQKIPETPAVDQKIPEVPTVKS